MASKWRFGCGKRIEVTIPRGHDFKTITVECGSTSYTGGVNQCAACEQAFPVSEPYEDEGDLEWFDRQEGGHE